MKKIFNCVAISIVFFQCKSEPARVEKLSRMDVLNLYYQQTDGTLVFPAVKILYEELENDPIQWYRAMIKDSSSFNRFLEDMGPAVFVQRDSCLTVEFLESLRQQDLQILKELNVPDSFTVLHDRLIKELEELEPRKIQ